MAILSIVAIGALTWAESLRESSLENLTKVQMQRVAAAIRQFHADTGYLPGTGPFALVTASPPGLVTVPPPYSQAWFHSPANVSQLLEQPMGFGQPVLPFDKDTGRGWRGPYLSGGGSGLVCIGAGLDPDGFGSPTSGPEIEGVPAIPDLFASQPIGTYLTWSLAGTQDSLAFGRPILVLGLQHPHTARLVSFGANGRYESAGLPAGQAGGDDLVVGILR